MQIFVKSRSRHSSVFYNALMSFNVNMFIRNIGPSLMFGQENEEAEDLDQEHAKNLRVEDRTHTVYEIVRVSIFLYVRL
jgi:hypothetical protein